MLTDKNASARSETSGGFIDFYHKGLGQTKPPDRASRQVFFINWKNDV